MALNTKIQIQIDSLIINYMFRDENDSYLPLIRRPLLKCKSGLTREMSSLQWKNYLGFYFHIYSDGLWWEGPEEDYCITHVFCCIRIIPSDIYILLLVFFLLDLLLCLWIPKCYWYYESDGRQPFSQILPQLSCHNREKNCSTVYHGW